jgi:hypothetical protein
MSEYQEEVLTNLLGLQAELRGDEPEPRDDAAPQGPPEAPADVAPPADPDETVAVTEKGLTVSVSAARTAGLGVNERLAALNERLSQLEYALAGVTKRIERIEPELEMEAGGSPDADVDARWRSFLDLQKIVADRLDQR